MKSQSGVTVFLKVIGVALLYAALAKLVLAFFSDASGVTLVWFPSGLGLVTIILGGWRFVPAVFVGALLAGLLVDDSLAISAGIAVGNTLESWLGAWFLSGHSGFSPALKHPRDFVWLGIAALFSAGFSALIGPMILLFAGHVALDSAFDSMLHWWMADVFGMALLTPLVLIWKDWPLDWFAPRRLPETLAFIVLSAVCGQTVFLAWWPDLFGDFAKSYWPFMFVIWAAARFGRHGVTLLITMTAVQSLWGLEHGVGPFVGNGVQEGLLSIWFYLLIVAAVGIPLALMLFDKEQYTRALRQSEARMGFALDTIGAGAWDLDLASKDVQRTPTHDRIFGYSQMRRVWSYQMLLDHVLPGHREAVDARFQQAIGMAANCDIECEIRRADGEKRWIRIAGCYLPGRPARMAGIVQDVTDSKLAEEDRQLAMLFYQGCSEAMMITDLDGLIVSVNPAFADVTGYAAEEVIGKNARILGSGRHDAAFFQAMWAAIQATGQWRGEIWNRRKNGELYVELLTINTIFDRNGLELRRIGVFFDITHRKLTEEQLWQQANFDPLTGAGNRRMLYARLDQEVKKSQRSGALLALMIVSFDGFKELNESLGYAKGDSVLQEVAQRLVGGIRETDIVARLDGAEFAVLLTELDKLDSIAKLAGHLAELLAKPYAGVEATGLLNCRIGIALSPVDASDAEGLQRSAIHALRRCEAGRYAFFNQFALSGT
ncbi:diguanylate cyclase [Methylococcaceae bacterium WWC4]|nr:diguanylate cyclase [Methylococcaceae bacterium WWC4]